MPRKAMFAVTQIRGISALRINDPASARVKPPCKNLLACSVSKFWTKINQSFKETSVGEL